MQIKNFKYQKISRIPLNNFTLKNESRLHFGECKNRVWQMFSKRYGSVIFSEYINHISYDTLKCLPVYYLFV